MSGYDWSAPRFLPITLESGNGRVTLRADDRTASLYGAPYRLDANRPLRATWTQEGDRIISLSLVLEADEETYLEGVTWFPGEWEGPTERVVSGTDLQDNVLFLRCGDVSFFLSLDFPYSRITTQGISYPAQQRIWPGVPYTCHSLSLGACRLSGERVGELDRAEIEAFSAYVEQRYPQRFERPLFLSACITNRMTDAREGRIFYSMVDNPTLALSPDLLEEDIRLCAAVGIEYFQVFEGVFDWPDEHRTGATYRRLLKLAKRLGVRLGGYVDPGNLYCLHYNYAQRQLERPAWRLQTADGKLAAFCLGCGKYADFLTARLLEHGHKYGEELICFDFLDIKPCYAPGHGHPPGDIYAQVRNLVALMQALARIAPEYLVWSNSGNWLQFMPKLTWYNPNVYLTDPHVRCYEPTLNALKLLGDGRREQMVTVHERYGVPYRALTNCEYYAFPRSRVHDVHVFEYSFLQGLAVTPNICPAELRPFLNRIPAGKRQACLAFMRKWLRFIREHYDVWKSTIRVGDAPGLGAAEIYAHMAEEGGFLCLVNQNPFSRTARFRLDGSIGLARGERFCVWEVYPHACPIAEQSLPAAGWGEELVLRLPAHSVRFLEVRPATACAGPQVYGLPAEIFPISSGYRILVRAPQGEIVELGLVLPPGEAITSVAARQAPTVPLYTFPVEAHLVEQAGNVARVQVRFPRERAPRELSRWRVSPGDVQVELPQLGDCPFLGALVHGAFSEDNAVELFVNVTASAEEGCLPVRAPASPTLAVPVPRAPRQTFHTEFNLPFIESVRWGCMPGWDDDCVVELAFADPTQVQSVTARLNGQPVPVQCYRYPRKPEWHTHYIELTGQVEPGPIELDVDIEWRKEEHETTRGDGGPILD